MSLPTSPQRRLSLLVCLTAMLALLSFASPASASVTCDRIAAPSGSDASGDGSASSPFATVSKLDSSLAPGQTGCLRTGTYGDESTHHAITTGGSPSAPVTITAYPGEHPKLVGWVTVEASYTTLSGLEIDGSNTLFSDRRAEEAGCPVMSHPVSQALSITGAGDVFENNELYQSDASVRSVGIGIGWWGSGDNTIVRHNRIHDVGGCRAFDHLIYLSHGANVQIYGNWMWNNPHGWGVQVYPGATGAQIHDNVVDTAGSGFFFGDNASVTGNTVQHNVVVNSTGLPEAGLSQGVAVSDYWTSAGSGNSFIENDSFNNPGGVSHTSHVLEAGNVTSDPQFVDASHHDYRVRPGSPVAAWSLWDGGNGAAPASTSPSPVVTLPPDIAALPNLAAGQAASASTSQSPAKRPAAAVDSNPVTQWAPRPRAHQWWQVDLGSPHRVGSIDIDWAARQSVGYRIQVSTDGRRWRRAASVSSAAPGWTVRRFSAMTARFVRVVDSHGNAPSALAIAEVRVTAPGATTARAARYRHARARRGARAARRHA